MAPTLAKPFHRPGWVYEEKYDGWRQVVCKDGKDGPRVRRRLPLQLGMIFPGAKPEYPSD
jgi:YD repeat-containing protein